MRIMPPFKNESVTGATRTPEYIHGSVRDQASTRERYPLDHRILEMCSLTTFPVLTLGFEDIVGQQI